MPSRVRRMEGRWSRVQAALDVEGGSVAAYLALAGSYKGQGRLADAWLRTDRRSAPAPATPPIRIARGDVYQPLASSGKALAEYRAAVALAPGQAAPHVALGRFYYANGPGRLGRPTRSRWPCDQQPADLSGYLWLGQMYRLDKQWEAALDDLSAGDARRLPATASIYGLMPRPTARKATPTPPCLLLARQENDPSNVTPIVYLGLAYQQLRASTRLCLLSRACRPGTWIRLGTRSSLWPAHTAARARITTRPLPSMSAPPWRTRRQPLTCSWLLYQRHAAQPFDAEVGHYEAVRAGPACHVGVRAIGGDVTRRRPPALTRWKRTASSWPLRSRQHRRPLSAGVPIPTGRGAAATLCAIPGIPCPGRQQHV